MEILKNMLVFSFLAVAFTACGLKRAEFGDWMVRLPEDSDYFYAVGGPNPSRQVANDNARSEMGKFISVTVDSEIERVVIDSGDEIDRNTIDQLQVASRETLQYLSLVEVKKTGEGYYTLARMPRQPLDKILEALRFKWVPPSTGDIVRSVLVPGWGQLEKKQSQKGLTIFGSQVLLLGGVLVSNSLKSSAYDDYLLARTDSVRQAYRDNEENYQRLMTGMLVATGAAYLYNLVDVSTSLKKVSIKKRSVSLKMDPSATSLTYQFRGF